MIFQGSKAKYAESIVPKLQRIIDENDIKCYIEPFVGGANVIDKIHCEVKIGYDKNAPLIALHRKAQENFESIPTHGSNELWYRAKDIYRATQGDPRKINENPDAPELWEIGAIAFLGSFNHGGFSRGYAKPEGERDAYNEAYRNLQKQAMSEEYKNICFLWVPDYTETTPIGIINKTLYYCDPPYEGTKPYGYAFETKFDYKEYWDWIRELSKTAFVICSEQHFPIDFNILWEKEVNRTMSTSNKFKATEKLGYYKEGLFKGFN